MSSSKYKLVKEGWGNRPNFQASYGLNMSPDDIEEGNAILEAMLAADAGASEKRSGPAREEATTGSKGKGKEGDKSSDNARGGERFGIDSIKYGIGEALAEQYGFTSTGDDETDMIIAMGLRDMEEEDGENSDGDLTGIGSSGKSEKAVEPQGGSAAGGNKRRNRKKKKKH
ncbi:hypothetical protein RUND412_000497 [Rhizina undulata]